MSTHSIAFAWMKDFILSSHLTARSLSVRIPSPVFLWGGRMSFSVYFIISSPSCLNLSPHCTTLSPLPLFTEHKSQHHIAPSVVTYWHLCSSSSMPPFFFLWSRFASLSLLSAVLCWLGGNHSGDVMLWTAFQLFISSRWIEKKKWTPGESDSSNECRNP